MRTVQMTLDEALVSAVDKVARSLRMSRSGFTREALRLALRRFEMKRLERRHREGYLRSPVRKGEFDVWHAEQAWGDGW
jgi:metal-responsive CopG/Arc/MetJ family transcriptional regulator